MHQGCPLAPFLFFFVAEAISSYLQDHDTHLQGLQLPIHTVKELLEAEFANDTAAYLIGPDENLRHFAATIKEFYLASKAQIKCRKSCGF